MLTHFVVDLRIMSLFLRNSSLWGQHRQSIVACRAFQSLKTGDFVQEPPRLHNQYTSDWFLQAWLKNKLPPEVSALL